jgi:hypothetical protein
MGATRREQAGYCAFLSFADYRCHSSRQQALRYMHILAALCRLLETIAGARIRQITSETRPFESVQDLPRLCALQEHRALITHMHQVVWRQRVSSIDCASSCLPLGTQAEDDARLDLTVSLGHSIRSERQLRDRAAMVLGVVRQVDAKIGERKVRD